MQCYERQAMYLKLYSDAVTEIPQLQFDLDLLDEILTDYSIDCFKTLIAVDSKKRCEMITRIKAIIGIGQMRRGDSFEHQDRGKSTNLGHQYSDILLSA